MENLEVRAICGLCSYSCRSGCRVKVELRNNKIHGVKADSDSPYGNLCPKGKKAQQIVYSPERLLKPLIRNGPKGTACFREASWDEALDVVEFALKSLKEKYGAAAICSYMGAGTLEESLSIFGDKFLQPFGTPNDMDCGAICNVSSCTLAPMTTFGLHGKNLAADLENADTVVIWGTNPMNNSKHWEYKRVLSAKRRGAKLVVIDPRRHRLAKLADYWVPVRPGTDGALALGIINLIIQKNWYDQDFVDNWVYGFAELKAYVSRFTPEMVAAICHTEKEMLYCLAELFAVGKRTAVLFYTGLEYAVSGVQNTRALYILWAITGNVDAEGGLYIPNYPSDLPKEYTLSSGYLPIGAKEYPVFYALTGKAHFVEFPKAVLQEDPYPVKALLLVGGSPYISFPQPGLWEEVYQKLEFMTVTDRFMVEECKWADVVLPAATQYEIESFLYDNRRISFRKKVIEPVGEAKNDVLIVAKIAERLGYGHLLPQTEKEILQRAFGDKQELFQELINSPDGVSLEKGKRLYKKYARGLLRKDGQPGFPTPTGKLEIKSSLLAKYGYEPLPFYVDPYSEEGSYRGNPADYPLALTTGARATSRYNSQYLNFPELTEAHPCPELEINPGDAFPRGIQSGQEVIVRTGVGQVKSIACVTPDICPGTVHLPHGGGGDFQKGKWKETNVNTLVSPENRDPISGYITCKAIACQVEKA